MKTWRLYYSQALSFIDTGLKEDVFKTYGTGEPAHVVIDKKEYDKLAKEIEQLKRDRACSDMKHFTTR